jgi:hypothetical protein
MNHRHPETPTCTPSGLAPDDEDPDDEDDDTPGGNPPDDEGGDLDDEPDHDEDDGLNAQDRVFMWLSETINNLAHNNRRTPFSDNSKVKVHKPDTFDGSKPRKLCAVRNHNSVGVKRPYLHELSFDHSHYGVA